MHQDLYFEDLHPGMKFNSNRSYCVTAEEIMEFAERYDPQPFHLDQAAGETRSSKASLPQAGSPQPSSCACAWSPSTLPAA